MRKKLKTKNIRKYKKKLMCIRFKYYFLKTNGLIWFQPKPNRTEH